MKSILTKIIFLAIVVPALASPTAQAQLGATVPNWTVPSSSSGSHSGGVRTTGDVTSPVPFIGVTPCRIVDTRGPAGPFGAPALTSGVPRDFVLPGGPCAGIPPSVGAYSLNITVTNTAGSGFILMFPQGGVAPVVSTLNYIAGQTVANAAIVPAGAGGGVTVIAGVSGTDLIIDINGYYGPTPDTSSNFFLVSNNSPTWTIEAVNSSTTCAGLCGLVGETSSGVAVFGQSNNSDGVQGFALGMTGAPRGVFGTTSAPNGFGVFGSNGAPAGAGLSVGVHGDAAVRGVEGQGNDNAGSCGVCGDAAAGGVGSSGVSAFANGGTFPALNVVGDFSATGKKSFIEPHPLDASKMINYVAMEGPEARNVFTGRGRFNRLTATIEVPEHFRMVTDEEGLTVQVTPIGAMASVAVIDVNLNQIVVQSSRNVEFFYTVSGVRSSFRNHQPVQENVVFRSDSAGGAHDLRPDLTPVAKAAMIKNGTLNPDGSWNREKAQALGWKEPPEQ